LIAWRTTFPCRPSRFLHLRVRPPFLELALRGHPTLDWRVPLRSGRRCARFGHEINARRVRIAPRSKGAPAVCNAGASAGCVARVPGAGHSRASVSSPAFSARTPKGCNRCALGAKKVSVTIAKNGLGMVTVTPTSPRRVRIAPRSKSAPGVCNADASAGCVARVWVSAIPARPFPRRRSLPAHPRAAIAAPWVPKKCQSPLPRVALGW